MRTMRYAILLACAATLAGGAAYAFQSGVPSEMTRALMNDQFPQSPVLRVDGDHAALKAQGNWALHCRAHCRTKLRLCAVIGPNCYDDAPIRKRLSACYKEMGC